MHNTNKAETYDKSRFFFGAQDSTYATEKKLKKKKRITIISYPKIREPFIFSSWFTHDTCPREAKHFTLPSKATKENNLILKHKRQKCKL